MIVLSFKSRVSCTFLSCIFQSKNFFLDSLYFFCLLYNLGHCLFQSVVSNFYHADHMLVFRVLHGREIMYPFLCDFGVFQVLLDRLRLGKLERLQVFCLCLRWVLVSIILVRSYSLQGRKS